MYLDVETNRWIVLALGVGLVLTLITFLSHIEGVRPRYAALLPFIPAGWYLAWRSVPWVLTLLTVGSVVLGLLYYYYRVVNPPTW